MNEVRLAVKGLTVTLREQPFTPILKDVSFSVGRGSITGIVGG